MSAQQKTSATSTRGSNYTPLEDKQLCISWLAISADPVVSREDYTNLWVRIKNHYDDALRVSGAYVQDRTTNSLACRWASVSNAVSQFCSIFATALETRARGTNEVDAVSNMTNDKKDNILTYIKLHLAHDFYAKENKNKPFGYAHCWAILDDAPKWKHLVKKRSKKASSSAVSNSIPSTDSNPSAAPDDSPRPTRNRLVAEISACVNIRAQKRSFEEMQLDESAMKISLEGLSEIQVKYWRLRQAEILAKYKRELEEEQLIEDGEVRDEIQV